MVVQQLGDPVRVEDADLAAGFFEDYGRGLRAFARPP